MIITVLSYLQSLVITIASGEFITVREQDFTGEDRRLSSALARRIDPPVDLAAGFSSSATLFLPDMAPPSPTGTNSSRYNVSEFLGSGRRQHDYYTTNFHVNVKILDLMRQAIYSARYRIESLERILSKYQKDERFRIAYIFSKLEQWEKEIRGIHQAAQFYEMDIPIQKHIYYYEHCLRRHVDVTYSLQFLYTLHHNFIEQYKQIMFGGGSLEWSERDIKMGYKAQYDAQKAKAG